MLAVVLALKRPKLADPIETQTTNGLGRDDDGNPTEWFIPTSCLNCPTRCAIRVRKVETNAGQTKVVRILGNPASTYSEGKCCSRSHVGLQVLYNADRFPRPLIRKENTEKGRGVDFENDFEETDWDSALQTVADRLNATSPDRLLILEGLNTTSNEDLIRQFALACGTPNLFKEEGLETDADHEGKMLADGRGNSGYELVSEDGTSTKYIIAFSSGIVESERPLARNLRLWGKLRRELPNKTKVVSFDSRHSVTASRADEWLPINPGSEGALAMAIAHVIIAEGLYDTDFVTNHTEGFETFRTVALAHQFSPESVSEACGVDAETITRIAREFAQSKPSIAWSGEAATSWPYGTFASHAIYCLNALVGSIDVPGGIVYQEYPPYAAMPTAGLPIAETGITFRKMDRLVHRAGVTSAIGFNSNLIMSIPESDEGGKWDEALKNLFYVHVGPARSEMAAYADVILPACTYLEDWGYESAIPGSGYAEARIKQPVIAAARRVAAGRQDHLRSGHRSLAGAQRFCRHQAPYAATRRHSPSSSLPIAPARSWDGRTSGTWAYGRAALMRIGAMPSALSAGSSSTPKVWSGCATWTSPMRIPCTVCSWPSIGRSWKSGAAARTSRGPRRCTSSCTAEAGRTSSRSTARPLTRSGSARGMRSSSSPPSVR